MQGPSTVLGHCGEHASTARVIVKVIFTINGVTLFCRFGTAAGTLVGRATGAKAPVVAFDRLFYCSKYRRMLKNREDYWCLPTEGVITSYSIHYTKLYETLGLGSEQFPKLGDL